MRSKVYIEATIQRLLLALDYFFLLIIGNRELGFLLLLVNIGWKLEAGKQWFRANFLFMSLIRDVSSDSDELY